MSAPASTVAPDEARTLAPFGRRVARVAASEPLGAYRLLIAEDRQGPREPHPGQFYMLAAVSGWGGWERPYLPRAFSFCSAEPLGDLEWEHGRPSGARLGFLVDPIGPGTARLAALRPGEELWLAGPFGQGFRAGRGRPLLVGGGIGVAPLLALRARLGDAARTLLGFRSAAHAEAARAFEGFDTGGGNRLTVVTDDGSVGRRALVTELLREELDRGTEVTVYACGPPPMLEAVRALCAEHDVPAQLALEAGMACGFGACFGCVVPARRGYLRLCVDGPVVDASALETALTAGGGH